MFIKKHFAQRLLFKLTPMRLSVIAACLIAGLGNPALGAEGRESVREHVEVVAVGDRLEMRLADGRMVVMPTLEPQRASAVEPERDKAVAAQVLALVQGKTLTLQPLGATDRWGRVPARLFLPDAEDSVDELLLAAGLAMRAAVAAPESARRAEDAAREAGVGLWADPAFHALTPNRPQDFSGREGALSLVEGQVGSIGRTRTRIYLNFGGWGGFYASVAQRNWPAFERAGFSETSLRNRKLRLRGIVDLDRAPHMELFHPEQIEFMDEPPRAAAQPSDPKF